MKLDEHINVICDLYMTICVTIPLAILITPTLYGVKHKHVCLSFFKVIAQQVSDKHLEEGRLYPPLNTIRDISLKIAEKVKLFLSNLIIFPFFCG